MQAPADFAACSGCGLCLLVCPVWRRTHDLGLSPLGRAKALQYGAGAAELAASSASCTLCAACEPVCPEEIALLALSLELRRRVPLTAEAQAALARAGELPAPVPLAQASAAALLLPERALRQRPQTLARARALLGGISVCADEGADIALALEAGAPVATARLERFLQPLRRAESLVAADGLLLRHLRHWLPRANLVSLGEALSRLPALRRGLRASDLYVIEARAYHADYQRLVKYYDGLRAAAGCAFNLDLQRIAIPASARSLAQRLGLAPVDDQVQLNWILQGRAVTRIVVESLEDGAAFAQVSKLPVVHLADLADDTHS
jgi:NAD-dependent dihydropyrimidine dehydrogenase PreA subunit